MTLVVDNRQQVGQGPGLHVLIAGVSSYTHLPGGGGPQAPNTFGMQQLTSAALSAYRVYEWIAARADSFPVPLATVRLLLAASDAEVQAEPKVGANASTCTLDDFRKEARDWRGDASADPAGMTIFYFAGHGVQRSRGDSVLLLQDFGDGLGDTLDKAINAQNLQNGMAPSPDWPNIARTQLYFFDACRLRPEEFNDYEQMGTGTVFAVRLAERDDRTIPTYFASVPGTVAYGRRGKETLFSKALLDCLDGGAAELRDVDGEEKWTVTHLSLAERLAEYLQTLASEARADQQLRSGGFGSDAPVHFLDQPPKVRVELEVHPPEALQFAKIAILDDAGARATQLPTPLAPHPFACELPAGIYTINTDIEPPQDPYVSLPGRARPLLPPRVKRVLKVAP